MVIFMLLLGFGMFVANVFYLIIFEGARVTIMGTELPFVDKDSDIGFWINILFQVLIGIVGVIACILVEIGAALVVKTVEAIPHLIRVDLEELATDLALNGSTLAAKARLRNVFMKIQDYQE